MEAELFGYARGAFTGAAHEYAGQLAAAAGGTVFPGRDRRQPPPAAAGEALRVLEDRVISRLGESTGRQVDSGSFAATNRDLRALVEAGAFGADLYERLAIVTIALPPLRGRLEDLPELAQRFVERFYAEETEAGPRVRGLRADHAAGARRLSLAGQRPRAPQRRVGDARLQAGGRRDHPE